MSTLNPMGQMLGDAGDPGDENDAQGIAECEQKIAGLDERVAALEQKAGMGGGQSKPLAPKPGGPMPFLGGSYK